jgi:hypothetical protein
MKVIQKPGDGAKKLEALIKGSAKLTCKVGWIESQKYENGVSVAQVAAQNEFGNPAKGIPARPFLRPAIKSDENLWKKTAEFYAKKIINGQATMEDGLNAIGLKAAGSIRKKIREVQSPPLSDRTIIQRAEKKKSFSKITDGFKKYERLEQMKASPTFTKPLIDDGIMINSITHSVENK